MSLTYNDLFAFRIAFLDRYSDENDIIRELKIELYNSGMNNVNDINNYLVNFYKEFNIEISLEKISEVSFNVNNMLNLNNISNSSNLINFFSFGQNNNSGVVVDELNNNSDSDSDDDSILEDNSDSDFDDLPELEDVYSNNDNNMIININGRNVLIPSLSLSNLNNQSNITNISVNNDFTNFINSINNFNNVINNANNMTDVRVTLDEKAESSIKSIVCKEDKSDICTICLKSFKKDDNISELKCSHSFHTSCIMPWLKEYSYKCPICRTECGDGKKNV